MKKVKSFMRFFKPSQEIRAIVADQVMPSLKGNFVSSVNLINLGTMGIRYKGIECYYIAYQTGLSSGDKGQITKNRNSFIKTRMARKAITMVIPKGQTSDYFSGISQGLSPQFLKAVERTFLGNIHSTTTTANKVHYAIFAVKHGKASIPYRQLSKHSLKQALNYLWQESPLAALNSARADQRELRERYNHTNYGSLRLVGGVHLDKGIFRGLYQMKMRDILKHSKLPMTSEKHTGVEIEAAIPRGNWQRLEEMLKGHKFNKYLALGTDGSVTNNDNYKGGELRICAPNSIIAEVVDVVCNALQSVDAIVDRSCGLHIHLDAREEKLGVSAERMFKNLVRQQECLYAIMPASRRDNYYCKWTYEDDWRTDDRYKSVNPDSFRKYQTVEVRLHSGTIMAHKINHWITLLREVAYQPRLMNTYSTMSGLLGRLGLTGEISEYLHSRIEKFKEAPEPNTSSADDTYERYENEDSGRSHHEEIEEEWPVYEEEPEEDEDDSGYYEEALSV